ALRRVRRRRGRSVTVSVWSSSASAVWTGATCAADSSALGSAGAESCCCSGGGPAARLALRAVRPGVLSSADCADSVCGAVPASGCALSAAALSAPLPPLAALSAPLLPFLFFFLRPPFPPDLDSTR